MEDFTITGEFALTGEEKHFSYSRFDELMSIINGYLTENGITDDVKLAISVPHSSFRGIDYGVRTEANTEDKNYAKDEFAVSYGPNLSVIIIDNEADGQENTDNG